MSSVAIGKGLVNDMLVFDSYNVVFPADKDEYGEEDSGFDDDDRDNGGDDNIQFSLFSSGSMKDV